MRPVSIRILLFLGALSLALVAVSPAQAGTLAGGETLQPGDAVEASTGQYRLIMQKDGNLVLYTRSNRPLWASDTTGNPGARAVMQGDGNLVVYTPGNRALFASHTAGNPGAHLSVQRDGNVVIYLSRKALWATDTAGGRQVGGGTDPSDGSNPPSDEPDNPDEPDGPGAPEPPDSPVPVDNTLMRGQTLRPGDRLTATSGQYRLIMQKDGNLVLYTRSNRPLWASDTTGNPGARAVMQGDGNLVVYTPGNRALFATDTQRHPGARLVVQNDGNLVVYLSRKPLWASRTVNNTLVRGEVLKPGDYLLASKRKYRLVMQKDGNLVLYTRSNKPLWSSRTAGNPGARAVMQGDGNLVVYTPGNRALFATDTQRHPGARLVVQNDRNVVVYIGRKALWATDTAIRSGRRTSSRTARAIAWARARLGSQAYNWWCAKFVAHAFGVGAYGHRTAWQGARVWGRRSGFGPRGTLVFFASHYTNRNAGHVGISLGGGKMISAEPNGVRVSSYRSGYWRSLYRGWNHAPGSWPGR